MNLFHLHWPDCDLLAIAPNEADAAALGAAWDDGRRPPRVTPMVKAGAAVIVGELVIEEADDDEGGDEVRIEPVDGDDDQVLTADAYAMIYDAAAAAEGLEDDDDDDEAPPVVAICGDTVNDDGTLRVCTRDADHDPPHRGKDAKTGEVVEWDE